MTKIEDTEDLIDLGAASVETRGLGAPIVQDQSQTKYPGPALSD